MGIANRCCAGHGGRGHGALHKRPSGEENDIINMHTPSGSRKVLGNDRPACMSDAARLGRGVRSSPPRFYRRDTPNL